MNRPGLAIIGIIGYHLSVQSVWAEVWPEEIKKRWLDSAHVAEQLQNAGDPAAEATWQRAIDGVIAELPPGSGPVALRLSRFAYSLHDEGLNAEAYPLASRAASMAETDGDRFVIAVTQSRVGAILVGEREYARGVTPRRSLAILRRVKGPDVLDTAVAENNLATPYSDTRRPAEAETWNAGPAHL